jgi:hypothetical protein
MKIENTLKVKKKFQTGIFRAGPGPGRAASSKITGRAGPGRRRAGPRAELTGPL